MIDWFNVFANSMWIAGFALALAVLSFASWQSSAAREGLRACLSQPSFQTGLNAAGLLICAGLAATSDAWWEILLWCALAIGWLVEGVQSLLKWRKAHEPRVRA
jgi:hypothetical protein